VAFFGVAGFCIGAGIPARLDGAKHAAWQRKERGNEVESSTNDNADKPEGQQHKPDERVKNDRGDGEGPARDEQNTEEEQLKHRCYLS